MPRYALRLIALGAVLAVPHQAPAQGASGTLRPGDRIVVTVRDTTNSVTIRADGQAVLPLIGPLGLGGLTPAAAEDSALRTYAGFLRRTDIRVTALRRISVQGEVPRADVFYVDGTMGLAEALALAGGVGPEGHRARVELWRNGVIHGRYDSRNGSSLRVPLESGDIVMVGRASWISRNPFVVVSLLSTAVSLAIALGR